MKTDDIIRELKRISIDNHRCFGCGREHSCSTRGCAIMRAAAGRLGELEQIAVQVHDAKEQLTRAAEVIRRLALREEPCVFCANKPNDFLCELVDHSCEDCGVESCACKRCNAGQKFIWEGAKEESLI